MPTWTELSLRLTLVPLIIGGPSEEHHAVAGQYPWQDDQQHVANGACLRRVRGPMQSRGRFPPWEPLGAVRAIQNVWGSRHSRRTVIPHGSEHLCRALIESLVARANDNVTVRSRGLALCRDIRKSKAQAYATSRLFEKRWRQIPVPDNPGGLSSRRSTSESSTSREEWRTCLKF